MSASSSPAAAAATTTTTESAVVFARRTLPKRPSPAELHRAKRARSASTGIALEWADMTLKRIACESGATVSKEPLLRSDEHLFAHSIVVAPRVPIVWRLPLAGTKHKRESVLAIALQGYHASAGTCRVPRLELGMEFLRDAGLLLSHGSRPFDEYDWDYLRLVRDTVVPLRRDVVVPGNDAGDVIWRWRVTISDVDADRNAVTVSRVKFTAFTC